MTKSDNEYNSNVIYFKQKEKEIFKIIFPKTEVDLKYTKQYERWDAVNEKQKLILEIKCRGFDYTFFRNVFNGDYLIEQDKYFALLKQAQVLSGYSPIYVFAFTNYIKGKIEWKDCQINGWGAINLGLIDESELIRCIRNCPENSLDPTSKKVPKKCFLIRAKSLNNYNSKIKILPNGKFFA